MMQSALLGDLVDVVIGKTPPRGEALFWQGSHPWVSIRDLSVGPDLWVTKEQITQKAVDETKPRLVIPGTVLLSFKLSIGKTAIARVPLYTNEAIAALPVRDTGTLHAPYLRRALEAQALDAGGNRASMGLTLNRSSLSAIRIPLPALNEQHRIAAILDQADELRAKRRRTLALLDDLLSAAFVKQFRHAANPSLRLADLGTIRTGKTPAAKAMNSTSLGTPFVTPGDLTSERPASRYVHDATTIAKVAVPAGSLLVCCIGATVGKMALATQWSLYNQQINSVEWGPRIDSAYGLFAVKALQGLIRRSAASTTMPILNKTQFSALKIPVPPLADQRAFGDLFRVHERTHNRSMAHLAHLDELFASLQHRAFTGQL